MKYNISYCICALVIIVITFWLLISRKDMRRKNSKIFLGILILEFAAICLDIWHGVMESYPERYSLTIRSLVSALFIAVHAMLAPLVAWYFIGFNGIGHKLKRGMRVLYTVPAIVLTFVPLVVPQLRRLVFHYNAEGVYQTGPLHLWSVCMGAFAYCVLILVIAYRHRRKLSHEQSFAVVFLVIFCSVPTVLEYTFFRTEFFNVFFEAAGIFIFLIAVDNQNWMIDLATNTYNRMTAQKQMQNDLDDGLSFDIVVVTISRERYFYADAQDNEEFQQLMNTVGSYLKGLRHRLDIYYCGRGTFLIPVYIDSGWKTEDLKNELSRRFSQPWDFAHNGKKEIMLPVRITAAKVPEEADTLHKIFILTDIPYDAESDEVTFGDAEQMLKSGSYQNPNGEGQTESEENTQNDQQKGGLPPELSSMLDDFYTHVSELSSTERKVVLYYMNGYDIADLPELMGVTINTVRKHNRSIYRKLQISSKEELMIYLDIIDRCGQLPIIEAELKKGIGDSEIKEKNA